MKRPYKSIKFRHLFLNRASPYVETLFTGLPQNQGIQGNQGILFSIWDNQGKKKDILKSKGRSRKF